MPAIPVRTLRPDEVEAWCACPRRPGEKGFEDWVSAERTWVEEHHPGTDRLFGAFLDDVLVGKSDVPFVRGARWTFYAPLVRPGPAAPDVLHALCRFVLEEASRRGVTGIDCLLEADHPHRDPADRALRAAGFDFREDRVLVRRDLRDAIDPLEAAGVRCVEASTLAAPDLERVAVEAGIDPANREHWLASTGPRGWVALLDGSPAGVAAVESPPGAGTLALIHLGVASSARRRGVGAALLAHALRSAAGEGSETYIGSTASGNEGMRGVFRRARCEAFTTRRVYGARVVFPGTDS